MSMPFRPQPKPSAKAKGKKSSSTQKKRGDIGKSADGKLKDRSHGICNYAEKLGLNSVHTLPGVGISITTQRKWIYSIFAIRVTTGWMKLQRAYRHAGLWQC